MFSNYLKFQMTSKATNQSEKGSNPAAEVRSWPSYKITSPDGASQSNDDKLQNAEDTRQATKSKWFDPARIDVKSKIPYQNTKQKVPSDKKIKALGNLPQNSERMSKCKKALLFLPLLLLMAGIGVGIYFAVKARHTNSNCPQNFIMFEGQCLTCPTYSKWHQSKCVRNNGQSVSWIVYNEQTDTPIQGEKQANTSLCAEGYSTYQDKCIRCPSTSSWNGSNCVRTQSTKEISMLEAIVQDYLSKNDHKTQTNQSNPQNVTYFALIRSSNKTDEVSNITVPADLNLKVTGIDSQSDFIIPLNPVKSHGEAETAHIHRTRKTHLKKNS